MKNDHNPLWIVVPAVAVGIVAFAGLLAAVGFDHEINEKCPMNSEDAFGRSFNELRRDCMGKRSDGPAPALTCGQLRIMSVSRAEDEWPEGVVARAAERRHCMFSSKEDVTSVSDVNTGQFDGVWRAQFVFDGKNEAKCGWSTPFDLKIENGAVQFSWMNRKYSGAITNNSWIMISANGVSPKGLSFAVLGPVLQPEVYHGTCGRGYIQMDGVSEKVNNVSLR